jgi:hypothetical protein
LGVTYTANFTTQYYLTTVAYPAADGSITPASGYYSSGVLVTASPNVGSPFTGFSGGLTGTTNPQNVTMTGPVTVTANFSTAPAITSITQNGAQVTIYGANLGTSGTVYFTINNNNLEATTTSWNVNNSGQIVATIPGTGNALVYVSVSGVNSDAVPFTPAPPPPITLTLPSGPALMGLKIQGAGLGAVQGGSTVTIGGLQVNPIAWTQDTSTPPITSITVQVPAGAAGTLPVVVTVPGVGASSTNFTVICAFGCGGQGCGQ